MQELKERIQEIRALGPAPTNQPNMGGPLSIDPIQMQQLEELVRKHRENGEEWFIVRLMTHELHEHWVGRKSKTL